MAINAVTDKAMGYTLWISFMNGFTSLVNNDVKDWASLEAIVDAEGAAARSIRYAVEPAREVSNAQMMNPGMSEIPLINGEPEDIQEKEAVAKQLEVVAEFDNNVFERVSLSPELYYASPMATAMYNKMVTAKESLILQYYGDGTGRQASLASVGAVVNDGSTDNITLVFNNVSSKPGCPYWIRENQKLVAYDNSGNAHDPAVTAGTVSYLKVISVDYSQKSAIVGAYASDGTKLDITGAGTLVADDALFNASDETNGGTFNLSSVADYGNLLYMPGLQSLGAADGRTVNGTVLSGSFGGTEVDAGGETLFFTRLGEGLSKLDRRVGNGKYDYPQIKTSYDTWRFLTDLDEGNKFLRPIEVIDDNGRGAKKYMYFHDDYACDVVRRRFVPDYEMWAEPKMIDAMAAEDATIAPPLSFRFTGFDYVKEPGNDKIFRFKIKDSQRVQRVQCHLQTYGTFICTQSASILRWKNFTLS